MTKCGLGRKVGEQFMKLHFPHLLQLRKICGWNWYKSAQYDLRSACLFRCFGVAQKYVVVGIFLHKPSNLGQCYDSFTCTVYTNKYTIYAFSGVLANESHFGSLWLFVSFKFLSYWNIDFLFYNMCLFIYFILSNFDLASVGKKLIVSNNALFVFKTIKHFFVYVLFYYIW